MAKKGTKEKRSPEATRPERVAESKDESAEEFVRRVRHENIRRAIAQGSLKEAEAFIQGYLSRGLLSQADVAALQAELARRRSNA